VVANAALPVAAYRVRFSGCTIEQVRSCIAKIIQRRVLTEQSGDQLMLSQS
jgi:hypothetical protein